MTLEERLTQLPQAADELAADVRADERLYQRIRHQAEGMPRKRVPLRRVLIPAGAFALAAVLLVLVWPGITGGTVPLNIMSVTAGDNGGNVPLPSTRADLPAGSVSLDSADDVPAFRNIWAGNSDSNFPMVMVNGAYYRLLSTPKKLSDKQLGSPLGTVDQYTNDMNGYGLCSNTVLQGETVWQVNGMGGAAVAARIDGSLRVFQRVTANGQGTAPASLAEAIAQSGVRELSLSGVGRVRNEQTAQQLLNTLLYSASYQGSGCSKTSQVLHIVFGNGVTLQMYVRDTSLSSGGTWSCPAFFEQFRQAI